MNLIFRRKEGNTYKHFNDLISRQKIAMDFIEITNFYVGQTVSFIHEITKRDIDRFVDLTGDDNPIHVDSEFVENTQLKTPVVHGMLTASFISTVIGKHLPGPGSLWVSQKLEFLSPVRVGDRIEISAEIKKIHLAHRLIFLSIHIRNHLSRSVIRGEAVVKWPEKSEVKESSSQDITSQRVALITGGSRGIGAEIAKKLGRQGCFVYINFNNSQSKALKVLEQVIAAGGRGEIIQGDVFDEKSVSKIFSEIMLRHNRLDILINNASPPIQEKDVFDLNWLGFEAQFVPHIKSMFTCIKEAIPLFEKNHKGSIVNIGSVVVDDPPAKWLGYNLGKGCVHLMTKNLATPLGSKGIRINTVAPGMTETDLTVDMPERQRMMLKMKTPLGKLAQAKDIAETVAFLAGDAANHITGQVVRVNGGIF